VAFWLSQIIFIATALLPWRFWHSDFGQASNLRERKKILTVAD